MTVWCVVACLQSPPQYVDIPTIPSSIHTAAPPYSKSVPTDTRTSASLAF